MSCRARPTAGEQIMRASSARVVDSLKTVRTLRAGLRLSMESLKRRTLLSGPYPLPADPSTDTSFSAADEARFRAGLDGLVSWVGSVESQQALGEMLPIVTESSKVKVNFDVMSSAGGGARPDFTLLVAIAVNELVVNLSAALNGALAGQLGLLSVTGTASANVFEAELTADLTDSNNDGRLYLSELDDAVGDGDFGSLLDAESSDTLPVPAAAVPTSPKSLSAASKTPCRVTGSSSPTTTTLTWLFKDEP